MVRPLDSVVGELELVANRTWSWVGLRNTSVQPLQITAAEEELDHEWAK